MSKNLSEQLDSLIKALEAGLPVAVAILTNDAPIFWMKTVLL